MSNGVLLPDEAGVTIVLKKTKSVHSVTHMPRGETFVFTYLCSMYRLNLPDI